MEGREAVRVELSDSFLEKWQTVSDLLADILQVPAALIMRHEGDYMEVTVSSSSEGNPYHPQDREKWHGLYCETVIKSQIPLEIPNALSDPHWMKNPDIKLGMIAYLGYPLNFPNKNPFGTICVLDRREHSFSPSQKIIMTRLQSLIEADLKFIEDQGHLENTLESSQAEYRRLFETMSQGVVYQNPSGEIISANPAAERILGVSLDQMRGLTSMDPRWRAIREDGSEFPGNLHPLPIALKTGKPVENLIHGIFHPQKNDYVWININAMPLFHLGEDKPYQAYATFEDITDRRNAEEELRKTQSILKAALDQSQAGIAIANAPDGKLRYVNDAGLLIRGGSRDAIVNGVGLDRYVASWQIFDLDGSPLRTDEVPLARAIMFGETNKREFIVRRDSGEDRVVLANAAPIKDDTGKVFAAVVVFLDTTEIRKYQQDVERSQKLEALGLLAGGIAHDFNNILGGFFGYLDLARSISSNDKVNSYLGKAAQGIDRARGLTQQLLTFAKGGSPIIDRDSLGPFLQESAEFAMSGSTLSCAFDIPNNLWDGYYDKNQLSQVLNNIIINAQQAMPNGGCIQISASNLELAPAQHPNLPAGNYVKISFKDSGIGIPKEYLGRIFDPFYTTKPKGHGLGLASSYSIIRRHKGWIDVESEPGKGSVFHLYIPAATTKGSQSDTEQQIDHHGSGLFLVMDDEEAMRETIGAMLELFGYQAILTSCGEEAIQIAQERHKTGQAIAGMIFDLTIPGGMGGKAAVGEIRKLYPQTPIFVASGYAEDPVMANPLRYGFSASICKPFISTELSRLLETHMAKGKG